MIFGTSYPKLKSGTTIYQLGKSLIDPSFAEPNLVEHRSIINGFKSWRIKGSGDHASFRITMNLFKYESPRVKFEELYVLNHQYVKLMLHQDSGLWFQDVDGNDADFFISLMLPFYLQTAPPNYQDRLLIELQSQKALNLTDSLFGYLVDGSGNFLIDGSGRKLKVFKGFSQGDEPVVEPWNINVADTLIIREEATKVPELDTSVFDGLTVDDEIKDGVDVWIEE